MQLTKSLGYFGLIASILVGVGEFYLHYSPVVLNLTDQFEFFNTVSEEHLRVGHFLAIIGLPFYFAGYFHIYRMLRSGNETLARIDLALGFVAFTVGGIWIGSRGFIGSIIHIKNKMPAQTFQLITQNYDSLLEILVQILRAIIALLSIVFSITILKGGTFYKKWMALFNPIIILILLVLIGKLFPEIGKYILPILMNITHFIIFGLSLYQLNKFKQHA